jgi:hypothetical protein
MIEERMRAGLLIFAKRAVAFCVLIGGFWIGIPLATRAQTVLIASNAVWRYLEDGSDQGTAWREAWYDDDNWGIGHAELGYGDATEGRPEATVIGSASNGYITTYFRRFFYVTNVAGISNLTVRLMRDDGGVVYLNSVEIFRSAMPEGAINYLTLASPPGASGAEEYTFFERDVEPALLFDGINLVAVEIHQRIAGSSDLSFALELIANHGVQPPPLPVLTRGPYLQCGTPSSVIVRWRTDLASDSRVRYGRDPGVLDQEILVAESITEHIVKLTGLSPDTKYYYAIGTSSDALASGADYSFVTSPSHGKPTRIWAIGDCGTASANYYGSWLVRDAYYGFEASRDTDVWLMLGDNAYGYGTDSEYQIAVFDTYQTLLRRSVLWSTIGNHETYAPQVGEPISYFDIFSFPMAGEAGGVPSGTENYYSFDYGNIHFVCLDSELSSRQPGDAMLNWLDADLSANTNEWTIAFWHSPPYSKGSHDSDNLFDNGGNMTQMRANVAPILENHGVDLVLCGHSHNYERSYLMHGHYGFSTELLPSMIRDAGSGRVNETGAYLKSSEEPGADEGTVYIVAGSSGWATFQTGRHPIMYEALLQMGSLVIDIDGERLDAKFLRETGAIDDYFTIIKGASPEPLRFATFQIQEGHLKAQWKSIAGYTYRIQKSASLENPLWIDQSDDILATGATTSWSDLADSGPGQVFFRVMQVAP